MSEEVIIRFDEVSFEYEHKKPILDEASFSIRRGARITLMGQNGAGKSTVFQLIQKRLQPKSGTVSIANGAAVGAAHQVVARKDLDLTVEKYCAMGFETVPVNIKSKIAKAFDAVNFVIPYDIRVGELSGGQQARLLLACALIQNPDILLLDEPTNNLDQAGIDHLVAFLVMYPKTVIVISHDAAFLNSFTEGVLYLDIFTKKIDYFVGDYYSVVEQVAKIIEKEQKKNAQLEKIIKDRKEKVNFFSHKGGKMRKLAKKLKDETLDLEENMVDVRKDDKTIREFTIPEQDIHGDIVTMVSVQIIKNHEPKVLKVEKILGKRGRLAVSGPNGIGKSTLLRSLVENKNEGAHIMDGVRVGYYSQDFATLQYDQTVFESLKSALLERLDEQNLRSVAAGFFIRGELMQKKVYQLSEGQKGLLSFARLVLMKPGLLVLDEPTNHINFRHIPVIARAINAYGGAIILISHMPDFLNEIKIDDYLDLGKL